MKAIAAACTSLLVAAGADLGAAEAIYRLRERGQSTAMVTPVHPCLEISVAFSTALSREQGSRNGSPLPVAGCGCIEAGKLQGLLDEP